MAPPQNIREDLALRAATAKALPISPLLLPKIAVKIKATDIQDDLSISSLSLSTSSSSACSTGAASPAVAFPAPPPSTPATTPEEVGKQADHDPSQITHDGHALKRRIPGLYGFCSHPEDHKCDGMPQRHRFINDAIYTKDGEGATLYWSTLREKFYALRPGDPLPVEVTDSQVEWAQQRVRVFGTRAAIRKAGLVPDNRVPVNALGAYDQSAKIEGFLVRGRGYTLPEHYEIELGMERGEDRLLTIDLDWAIGIDMKL